jgi:hypothetical protein
MSKFKKMHMMGGTVAIICIMWNFTITKEAFITDWQKGSSLLSSLAIGGYMVGSAIAGIITIVLKFFQTKDR